MEPTHQQQSIIDSNDNAVVIAAPGSGKTFVISKKIQLILKDIEDHEGVIAISYTNKASNELKNRSLKNGLSPKSSFFGTIDKFDISEIIIPFGKQLFDNPSPEIEVVKISDLSKEEQSNLRWFSRDISLNQFNDRIEQIKSYFLNGKILIETIGVFANYIFSMSEACRKYIRAKYRYIFIDEYQDSGLSQHEIFLKINQLGLIAVAVGDLNQSIYAFSGKDPRFLWELTQNKNFKYFLLDKNHRCHPSIINYSNYLLNPKVELISTTENNVHFFRIEGNEINIAEWIDIYLESIIKEYNILKKSDVAILVRGDRTGSIINKSLKTPNKYLISTSLDNDLNIWSCIFSKLLYLNFNKDLGFVELIEEYQSIDCFNNRALRKLKTYKEKLHEELLAEKETNIKVAMDYFIEIARIIAPESEDNNSINQLNSVLSSELLLNSYKGANENELNIMTLHKSKGLEFEVVIHLDLYKWIMPMYNGDFTQDLNLHYVGVTRAKKSCVLISSTQRTHPHRGVIGAEDSEFIDTYMKYKKAVVCSVSNL